MSRSWRNNRKIWLYRAVVVQERATATPSSSFDAQARSQTGVSRFDPESIWPSTSAAWKFSRRFVSIWQSHVKGGAKFLSDYRFVAWHRRVGKFSNFRCSGGHAFASTRAFDGSVIDCPLAVDSCDVGIFLSFPIWSKTVIGTKRCMCVGVGTLTKTEDARVFFSGLSPIWIDSFRLFPLLKYKRMETPAFFFDIKFSSRLFYPAFLPPRTQRSAHGRLTSCHLSGISTGSCSRRVVRHQHATHPFFFYSKCLPTLIWSVL